MKTRFLLTISFVSLLIASGFSQYLTQGTILKTGDFEVTVYARTNIDVPAGTSLGMLFAISVDAMGETDVSNAPPIVGTNLIAGPSFTPAEIEIFNGRFVYPFGLEGNMTNGFIGGADNPVASITLPADLAGEIVQLNDFTGSGSTNGYWYPSYNGFEGADYDNLFYGSNFSNEWPGDSWVESDAPLPVTLIKFDAEKYQEKSTYLEWATVSELNSSHFLVQRSTDKKVWVTAGKVAAAGNSQMLQNYEFVDYNVYNGIDNRLSVYYRLQMVDFDGQLKNSSIENVVFGTGAANGREFLVYPNPASDGVQIEWETEAGEQPTSIQFYDVAGKLIYSQPLADNSNQEYVDFSQTNIKSGLYFLRIMSGTEAIEHKQIVVGQNR